MDVALQYGTISVSWFVVIGLLSMAITFEPTIPDVISWIGGVNDARCTRQQGLILLHILTPPMVAEIKRTYRTIAKQVILLK